MVSDDPALLQGMMTLPPLECLHDWQVEGADLTAYSAWRGRGLVTVREVEEAAWALCSAIDARLGEGAAKELLGWCGRRQGRRGGARSCRPTVHPLDSWRVRRGCQPHGPRDEGRPDRYLEGRRPFPAELWQFLLDRDGVTDSLSGWTGRLDTRSGAAA
jgi:hypothetical protein